MAYIVDTHKSCDTCKNSNCKHGKYYILRDSQGNYLKMLSSGGNNYFSMMDKVSKRDDVTVEDAFEDFEISDDTKEKSIKLTEYYLEYVGDYEDSIEPLNSKQNDVDNYKILSEDIREDLYTNVFKCNNIDYKYAEEIFELVDSHKASSHPNESMSKLESIIGYANNQEPDVRGNFEPYDRDELDDDLIEAMNIISGVSYGAIKKLYGDNVEVVRINHSYSQSKILNKFLSNPDNKIRYDDNMFVNYTMSNEVIEVFSGDVVSTVEIDKDNLLYSPDITFPNCTNRNELEVNLKGKNLELDANNVTFNGERLSDKIDYNGLKDDDEFIQNATKKILRNRTYLNKDEKDKFVKNVVKLENDTLQSIDAKTTLECMRYYSEVLDTCLGSLNAPNPRNIRRGDKILVNGLEQIVESFYDEMHEVFIETYDVENEEYNSIRFKNNITTDDYNNPINVELQN